MISKLTSSAFGSLLLLAGLLGCGGGAPKTETPPPSTTSNAASATAEKPICHEVHERCEPFEGKGGLAQECHDLSEGAAATESVCAKRKDECLKACAAKP